MLLLGLERISRVSRSFQPYKDNYSPDGLRQLFVNPALGLCVYIRSEINCFMVDKLYNGGMASNFPQTYRYHMIFLDVVVTVINLCID